MAEDKEIKKEEVVQVPAKFLTQIQEQMAELEKKVADSDAKNAGLEELFKTSNAEGEQKLRAKKTFEPKFRTVRIRKFPIAGDENNLGYVIGWTNKGAYQEVDRSGVTPQIIDFIDVVFLGHEKTKEGKIRAEKVKLLDLFNKGVQIHCKILDSKIEKRQEPTGEEIAVTTWDPQHGLIDSGERIDGWVGFTDITYTIQIPGVEKPVVIDALFVN